MRRFLLACLVAGPHAAEAVGGDGVGRAISGDEKNFAFALYRSLGQQPGNLCFSPFSIRVAFAMAEVGARGETAAQIRDALGSESSEALLTALKERQARSRDLQLDLANALWSQTGSRLESEFRAAVAKRYGGEVSALDFRGNAEGARAKINGWVEARTHDKIRDLLPPHSLDAARLVLVNAIYFKDKWMREFEPGSTREAPFHREDGGTVQVPMMSQRAQFPYLHADGYQVVELAYKYDLSMLVLLPDAEDGLRNLESQLSAELFQGLMAELQSPEVEIFLPRFTIRSAPADLVGALAALGITRAFSSEAADFSGINGHRPPDAEALFVSSVFHQAFVDVGETGTEAAAATGLGFAVASAMKPPRVIEFRADHPFVFAIRERTTGEILFLGRVTDPTR